MLVAMCGIPFAGKSTIAKELACRCGFALVSVDEIVRELRLDLGAQAEKQRAWALAMAEGFERSRRLLAGGESVIYDNANHSQRNRDRCRRIARHANAAFQCVWVDVPVETARARLEANRLAPMREDVPDPSFRQIVEEFEPPIDEPDVIRWQPGMDMDELIERMIIM
jgi:predicted kinase